MIRNEFDLIEKIVKKIPRKLQGLSGIGDDTAVLPGSGKGKWLFTADILVDGIDFISKKTPPELVGRKALAVNLSDIAAMGGEPRACLISLGIPRHFQERWLERFYAGLIRLAKKYSTYCVGGDISRSREFFVSIALLGFSKRGKVIRRSGARPGDALFVTGKLGGSIRGHHLRFEPRLREAQYLARDFHPTSMIDISDGFVQDLGHLLKQSKCGARLNLEHVPLSGDSVKQARGNRGQALKYALTEGEDFELLFTVPDREKEKLTASWKKKYPKVSLSQVGEIIRGPGKIFWQRNGKRITAPYLKTKGYSHF